MRGKTDRGEAQEASVDRITRVNEILKREIADLLQRESFNEDGKLISVTRVQCATTLKQADVFVSMFGVSGEAAERQVLDRLYRLRGEIQRRVAKHVILKYTPVLTFVVDRNVAEGDRVLELLRELEENESK